MNRRSTIVALALLGSLSTIPAPPPLPGMSPARAAEPDGQFRQVVAAYRTDPELCIRLSDELLASSSLDPVSRRDILLLMAKAQVHAGRPLEARRLLETLREEDPNYELDGQLHRVLWPHYLAVFGAELRPRPGLKTICVFDFENRVVGPEAANWDGLGATLARKFETSLAGATELRLVERERIDYILRELDLCEKQSPDTRVCAGRLAGAQIMIFGEFTKLGKDSEVFLRIAETETSYLLGGSDKSVRGDLDKTVELIDALSRDVAKELDVHINAPRRSSNRYQAWYHYGKALDQLALGEIDQGYQSLVAALEEDPEFEQAKEALDEFPYAPAGGNQALSVETR